MQDSQGTATGRDMFVGEPPAWALVRPKSLQQAAWDLLGAPLRMAVLPDHVSERLHLTSLRGERLAVVLPELLGRVLDIGAGDNGLTKLYMKRAEARADGAIAAHSVGLDVVDWGGGCTIVRDCRHLPFPDASFDTVCFVACLNHIPERAEALGEAHRVLRKGGRVVVTMIGRLIGNLGHAIWWYSEDKHREVQPGEVMGMDPRLVRTMIAGAGFENLVERRFVYGLNHLFTGERR